MRGLLLLLIWLFFFAFLFGCSTQPETQIELGGGFIVPDNCGDRWVCEGQCEEGYEWACEPWEKK